MGKVILFGSVAAPLKKEVPRFRRLIRAGVDVWHERNDVDLAVWVSDLARLHELKRAVVRALNEWQAGRGLFMPRLVESLQAYCNGLLPGR